MSFNVGINVVEVDGRAAPSIQPAPTSVTGFSIKSQRGIPDQVVRVTNWGQFLEHFGGYVDSANGAYVVRGFFDNGGTTAYVTRVVHTGTQEATAAVIASNAGPWSLDSGDSLTFASDRLTASVTATFTSAPAVLQGAAGPFDLDAGAGSGKDINLVVNGVAGDVYQFVAADFAAGLTDATAGEVAAVLNREFAEIQAWVDATSGELHVRTDRGDNGASLQASGTAAADLGLADDGLVNGSGNVANINAVTPAEAVAAINGALGPEGFSVTQNGARVVIEHPDTGASHWIQVVDAGDTVPGIFGYDNLQHRGVDATAVGAAWASSHPFGSPTALTVTAGYRGQTDVGAWGDSLSVEIATTADQPSLFDVIVRQRDRVVETWTGLSMRGSDPNYVERVVNDEFAGSKFIVATASGSVNPPVTPATPLTGGSDGAFSGRAAELNAYAASIDLFELFEIQLLCCPEAHEDTVVSKALTHCTQKGDRMFVGHTPRDLDAANVKDAYSGNFQGDKVYGALYFPWIQVADPLGTRKWIPPTGHVIGVYARTEQERGIWKAPAGNAARLNGALDVRHHITDVDHTSLVKSASVNAVRFIPGQGIVIDSSRTLSTSPLWLYVNVRLLFNFVKSSLKSGLRWVVQEPNDDALWNKVKYNTVTPFLMGLWRRGAFGPGSPDEVFTVKIDAENNPPANIQQGIFTVEVYFYPSRPAETIIITIGQQEGGAAAGEG
jgi:phage tail sheath protein FI